MTTSSGLTMWATTQPRDTAGARYHGFPHHGHPDRSYCGIDFAGPKRMTPPDRDSAVCEHCATACGFTRRPGRNRSRKRGSRSLGTSTERIEAALARMEEILARMEEVTDG